MSAPLLCVEGLRFTYPAGGGQALADVSFELQPGTWTVLAGKSGSGKSTLLRAIAGLHLSGASTVEGVVEFERVDAWQWKPLERAKRVGLVLQSPDDQLCATTAAGEIAFGLCNLGWSVEQIEPQVTRSLERAGLEAYRDAAVAQLSGGQKQRLTLAAILAMSPQVLLLDEPLSQLDPQAARDLLFQLNTWRCEGGTILMAEHRLNEVLGYADQFAVLVEGAWEGPVDAGDVHSVVELCQRARLTNPDLVELARLADVRQWKRLLCDTGENRIPREQGVSEAAITKVASPAPHMNDKGTWLVQARGLEFRFEPKAAPLWSGVNLTIWPGDMLALMGPNGAGKSTLLSALAGLARATAGTVEFQTTSDGPSFGLVPQNPDLSLFCSTVREELSFGPRKLGLRGDALQARVGQTAEAMRLMHLLEAPPLGLSQGERLRTAVAAMVTLRPAILMLDEPTTGQDPEQVERLMEMLREIVQRGQVGAILLVTHDLRTVERFATRLALLAEGELFVDTTPRELMDRPQWRERARLTMPPLWEFRQRWGLSGVTTVELAHEWKVQCCD
jgi:energy-coupling factor transport system ATP-binding protein